MPSPQIERNNSILNKIININKSEIKKVENFRKLSNTAVLSIMFTDIKDFTLLTEKVGDIKSNLIRKEHDKLFINIITRDKKGEIIKHSGDSFFAIFSEPSEAVKCGLEFQQSLSNNSVLKEYNLEVRLGIHLGQVSYDNTLHSDLFGSQINKAARIMSVAKGGQILTSQSVWENASSFINKIDNHKVESSNQGTVKLKGIKNKINLYEFYFSEVGSKGIPKLIQKQKINIFFVYTSLIITFLLILFLTGKHYEVWKKIHLGFKIENPNQIKRLYLADIISNEKDIVAFNEVMKHHEKLKALLNPELVINKSIVDSNMLYLPIDDSLKTILSKNMIQHIIALVDPDYLVVTEDDIKKEFASKGKTYPSINSNYFLNYYKSTKYLDILLNKINCNAGFYVRIYKQNTNDGKDLYTIDVSHKLKKQHSNIWDNIEKKDLLDEIMRYSHLKDWRGPKQKFEVGSVLSYKNNEILISLKKEKNYRIGSKFLLAREYKTKTTEKFFGADVDTLNLIKDFKSVKNYFKTDENWKKAYSPKGQFGNDNTWSPARYQIILQQNKIISKNNPENKFILNWISLGIEIELIELFDSTAFIKIVDKKYPWCYPRIGDKVMDKRFGSAVKFDKSQLSNP